MNSKIVIPELKTAEQLIDYFKKVTTIAELVDLNNVNKSVAKLLSLVHTDVCKLPEAEDIFQKISNMRDSYNKPKSYKDDIGEFTTNGFDTYFSGNKHALLSSKANCEKLFKLGEDHFKRYIPDPKLMIWDDNEQKLHIKFEERAIPLSKLNLEQKHTNWVLSRMLEFTSMLDRLGYVHAGLNPESVFVVPETHGIKVVSFYHLTKKGEKMTTISNRYKDWYPKSMFSEKIAKTSIDIELCKRIAVYLLGDVSGIGIRFKKTHNKDIINYLLRFDQDSYKSYDDYRKILSENFKKEYIPLFLI